MDKKSHPQAIMQTVHSVQTPICRFEKSKIWFLGSIKTEM